MSTTIDQKVVEMSFDNKNFEENVKTSLTTLDKLKRALNFDKSSESFESITKSAKNVDLSGLANGVESIGNKFSAMEIVAISALANITSKVVDTGIQLVKSLSVDQLSAGWTKFGEKTTSVGTLVAQGYDIETVNEQLERLNWFTDETSYNFTDMVANIAKFTASGQKLETSVTALEGIANWAALSGQNATTASRAMYQISQAMGAGIMRKEDYKSIQNVSMDTDEFRQKALDAAVALGTLKKNADGTYKSLNGGNESFTKAQFAEHLTEDAWFTSDVMMKVFNDYSKAVDQIYEYSEEQGITASEAIEQLGGSVDEFGLKAFRAAQEARTFGDVIDSVKDAVSTGWMNTFEIVFGNYEEAKSLWTDLANAMYDVFAAGAWDRNEMLQGWKDLGGRDDLINAFWNTWEGIGSIIDTVKEAFNDIFPAKTLEEKTERLKSITSAISDMSNKFKEFVSQAESNSTISDLKNTFKGLFAVLSIVKQAFSALFKAISPLFGASKKLGSGILELTGSFGEWLVTLDESIKKNETFDKIIEKISTTLGPIIESIKSFAKAVSEKFVFPGFELFHSLLERLQTRMSQFNGGIESGFDSLGNILENCAFIKILNGIWNIFKAVTNGILNCLKALGGGLSTYLKEGNFSGLIDLLNSFALFAVTGGFSSMISGFTSSIKSVGDIVDSFSYILDEVGFALQSFGNLINAKVIKEIAVAIAILAASLLVLSLIDSDKLSTNIVAMTAMFAELVGSMKLLGAGEGIKGNGVKKQTSAMISMAVAILVLSFALKEVSEIDQNYITNAIIGITALVGLMVGAVKILSSGGKKAIKGATQMVVFAFAIKILAGVCKSMAQLSWEEMGKGLLGVGALLGEVALFLNFAKFSNKTMSTAIGIVILSAALKILASVCSDFGSMGWEEIGKGLAGIAGSLIAVIIALNFIPKNVVGKAVGLIGISAALKILASACMDFGAMSWEEIGNGLAAIAGSLTAVTIALNFMPKNMISKAIGLIGVSAALMILTNVLSKMGGMSWTEMGKSMAALGGSMLILAMGLNAMNGTIVGSAALIIASAALLVLSTSLALLGAMSWVSIGKSLLALAGVFVILGVAGYALGPVVPVILGLAGALALIGASVMIAGAGILMLAIGISALATAVTVGAAEIVAGLSIIILGIVDILIGIVNRIGEIIVAICNAISDSAGAIGNAIKSIVLTLVDVLVECAPAIVDGILKILACVLESLVTYSPSIIDSIFKFIISLIDGLANNLPDLIKSVVNLLTSLFYGVIDVLKGIDTQTLIEGIIAVGLISALIVALSAIAPLIPGAMLGVLGIGGVIAEMALIIAAIGALAQIPGLTWLINEGGELLECIGVAIGKFLGGIVGGMMSGISSQFPQIGTDLSNFMINALPFIVGASAIDPSMLEGVRALVDIILLLTAADILQGLTSWFTGGSSLASFGEELIPFGKAMLQFSEELKGIDSETVVNASIAGKALAEMASTLPNSGGVLGFFAGENDMEEFGKQLVPFGAALKTYSLVVKGIDAGVVENSVVAGEAIIRLAETIPNSGGLVGFFVGENDMAEFGNQLVPFGVALKTYSLVVKGIDAGVVENSVVAGEALIKLAETIPNTGGLLSFFTGDNDLATFASGLVPFGKSLKKYSSYVKNINTETVTNSANAAQAIVALANNLPNTGGIASWFSGDNDIETFGNQLSSFGKTFTEYYDSIKTINTITLTNVTLEFGKIIDMAKGLKDIDTSELSNFGKHLKELGKNGVDSFIKAFTDANSKVNSAGSTMITTFNSGVNSKTSTINTTFVSIAKDIVKVFTDKYEEFKKIGTTLITKIIDGANSQATKAKNSFSSIISSLITDIKKSYDNFSSAGKYLVEGFAYGIESNEYLAKLKASAMAQAAATAAEKELKINSPSKVGYKIGGFFGIGFVNALDNYADISYKSGASMASSAREGLLSAISKARDIFENGFDSQPVIRPVIDLSEVQSKAHQLNSILSRTQALRINSDFNSSIYGNQNGSDSSGSKVYNFTQNNYSPKALSRIDIYRQTKNQFAAMKGLVTQ